VGGWEKCASSLAWKRSRGFNLSSSPPQLCCFFLFPPSFFSFFPTRFPPPIPPLSPSLTPPLPFPTLPLHLTFPPFYGPSSYIWFPGSSDLRIALLHGQKVRPPADGHFEKNGLLLIFLFLSFFCLHPFFTAAPGNYIIDLDHGHL